MEKPKVKAEVPKGTCPKCGNYIGRGVGLHALKCDIGKK
jgi:hypothetical protein